LLISKVGQDRQTGPGIGPGICLGISFFGIVRAHISGKIRQYNLGLRSNIVGRPDGVAAGDASADCNDAMYPTKPIESVTIKILQPHDVSFTH